MMNNRMMDDGKVRASCENCLLCRTSEAGTRVCAFPNSEEWTGTEDDRWKTEEKICCVLNLDYVSTHDPVIMAIDDDDKRIEAIASRYGYQYIPPSHE